MSKAKQAEKKGKEKSSAAATASSRDFSGSESDDGSDDGSDGLLPLDISPVHYALRLVPNYADWTFRARLVVSLCITAQTDLLQFNAADLEIDQATVRIGASSSPSSAAAAAAAAAKHESDLTPTSIKHDEEEEVTTLRFDAPLPVGDATLIIEYRGRIGDQMIGLYRSHYVHAGAQHTILVTQFEACDARRCLPCWDEPARKATFALTLVVPSEMQALGNMPIVSSKLLTEPEPDRPDMLQKGQSWTEVSFDVTPVMSSYLLAFAIGRFESVQTSTKTGTLVRVLTPLGKIAEADFSLDLGRRCLEFYEDFFGLAYPLPKMDLVCVPDIAITAMENWGLITFGETVLLVHPTDTSLTAKHYAARIVAHEIAHQWVRKQSE